MLKRSFRTNIYSNTVGYEGGKRAVEFGCQPWSEKQAAAWVAGYSEDDAMTVALLGPAALVPPVTAQQVAGMDSTMGAL